MVRRMPNARYVILLTQEFMFLYPKNDNTIQATMRAKKRNLPDHNTACPTTLIKTTKVTEHIIATVKDVGITGQ